MNWSGGAPVISATIAPSVSLPPSLYSKRAPGSNRSLVAATLLSHLGEICVCAQGPGDGREGVTGGVGEQVLDGDLAGLGSIEERKDLVDGGIERETSFIDQHLDRGADEGFGHGADAIEGVDFEGLLGFTVFPAEGLAKDGAPVLNDDQFAADDFLVVDHRLHAGGEDVNRSRGDAHRLRVCIGEGNVGLRAGNRWVMFEAGTGQAVVVVGFCDGGKRRGEGNDAADQQAREVGHIWLSDSV